MAPPYIPTKDADLVTWADNFRDLINASPVTYGLTAGDATVIDGVVDSWDAAYVIAANPSTRTVATVAAKDAAKASMLAIVRPYAQQIKNNLGVSNEDKAALGLNLDDGSVTPIAPPTTQPLLNIIDATPLVHRVRFADAETPDSRAKPDGVSGLQIYSNIGSGTISDPAEAAFVGVFTKQPFLLNYVDADRGKIATLFGRWMNEKGQTGPWSNAVSLHIV